MTLLQNEVEAIHRAKKATNAIQDDVAYAEVESAVEDLIKVIGRVQARLIQSNERIKRLEEARTVAAANSLANMISYEDAINKIKRLEEAGEWVAYAANEDDHRAAIQAWEKAKEAKP